jgi:hypothetical protein
MSRAALACALALAGVLGGTLLDAQIPFQPGWRYRSGQNVVPAFEGWRRNPDGSIDMLFGYLNRNYEETIDIAPGANNSIEPGGPDQGQPTFFREGRQRFVFAVRVPKDWPPKRSLIWTLTVRGRTEKANAFLLPEWELDTASIQGSLTAGMDPLNKAPTISAGPPSSLTITLPATATLTASVADDGRPMRGGGRGGAGGAARGAAGRGRGNAPAASSAPAPDTSSSRGTQPAGARGDQPPPARGAAAPPAAGRGNLRVEWVQYRGPAGGRITFLPATTPVADDKASTTATFSMPGRYTVRAFANDGGVTTPADFTVIVNAARP